MDGGRSVVDVLQDILRNLQEIVRSEVRLARVEIRDEAKRTVSSCTWIAAGAVGALSAWVFLLWTAAYLLATNMAMWGATLVVSVVMAGIATVLIVIGIRRVKRVRPLPQQTIESVKENLEWMKHPAK